MDPFTDRIKFLNSNEIKNGKYIVYWMQASQRVEYNHVLEYSILKANDLNLPLLVFFGLTKDYPEANERHYYFMLEGLKEIKSKLAERGIQLIILDRPPEFGAIELSKNASFMTVDRGYLKIERTWRKNVAKKIKIPLIQIESDVVLPIEVTSEKEEYSAATIRPKIEKKIKSYMVRLKSHNPKKDSLGILFDCIDINKIENVIDLLGIDRIIKKVSNFQGSNSEAKRHLETFLKNKLDRYNELRNDPSLDFLSNMSPYLHFGQISPLYIALKVQETESPGKNAYLEELIVRRELSNNYIFYNHNYDNFNGLPAWSKETLRKHEKDKRDYIYSKSELENAETHDPYWNAAQNEMKLKGKMHGYMRMYWGKKIIEWSKSPNEAYRIALRLNNKYELDGRDANGYTGIAWCFGKHDRPWKERKIFGKIRYMSAEGLERKFNIEKYARKIS